MKSVLLCLALVAVVFCDRSSDQLFSVPRYSGTINFDQYAGYIKVNPESDGYDRKLYYWFAYSQNDPVHDPVTLWLNGGPGCSSLDGLFYEHGPWHFASNTGNPADDTIIANPYSWNMNSNMIYLEAPAGVGYSYSDNTADYHTNDNKTADDNYQFLLNFFQEFPEFQKNDFYVAGESYAGVYVPTLAYTIDQGNAAGNTFINLKGYIVGNGVTNEDYDSNSYFPFAAMHGLFSPHLAEELKEDRCYAGGFNSKCAKLKTQAREEIGDVNIYGIYNPCYKGSEGGVHKIDFKTAGLTDFVSESGNEQLVPPCINVDALTEYLNNDTVRGDLHALPSSQIGQWAICSDVVKYTKLYNSIEPIYNWLGPKYKILVYSGDTDGAVPFVGTVGWIHNLQKGNAPGVEWEHWTSSGQVAGYYTTYQNDVTNDFTFTTIKGAGHMVPQDKPPVAYQMFTQFIEGNFPTST